MTWFTIVPATAVALLVLAATGAPIAAALGIRGRLAVSLVPLFAISVLSVAAFATALVPGSYGILVVLAVTAVLSAAALGVRMLLQRVVPASSRVVPTALAEHPAPSARRIRIAFAVGAATAAVLIGWRLLAIFGDPDSISQTFDNIYHLNAVRYILETGDASPLTFSSSTYAYDGQGSFYPAAWHAFTGVVAQLSGSSVPVAVNAVSLVIGAVIWPLGLLLLSRVLLGDRVVVAVATGVLAPALGAFPYLMVDFGVLYPNLLSIALLPGVIALGVMGCRLGPVPPVESPRVWLALLAALPGLALAHPSTLIALVIVATPPVLAAGWLRAQRLRGRDARRHLIVHLALLGSLAVAGFLLIWKARPTFDAAFWQPSQSLGDAVVSAATLRAPDTAPDLLYTVLVVAGAVALLRARRHRWLIVSHAIMSALWIVALWAPFGAWRYRLVGTWYSDENRIEALLPVTGIPLAVVGAVLLIDLGRKVLRDRAGTTTENESGNPDRRGVVLVGSVLAALLVVTQLSPALAMRTEQAAREYAMTDRSSLITPDEAALLERADGIVPEDGVVLGSPWTGSSLVYTYAGRLALMPAIYGDRTEETLLLLNRLRYAEPGSVECEAIEEEGVTHVLDFGAREVHGGSNVYPGLQRLSRSSAVELVDSEGDAELYAVTACDD